jgi:biopolymer transport protein ExbD
MEDAMAMSAGRRRSGSIAEINVTPMADVMIVLLITFMVATPIIGRAPVRLPVALHSVNHPEERVEIVVSSSGQISMSGMPFASPEVLRGYVESRRLVSARSLLVLVQADRDARYADVSTVLSACRNAGVTEVALASRRRLP